MPTAPAASQLKLGWSRFLDPHALLLQADQPTQQTREVGGLQADLQAAIALVVQALDVQALAGRAAGDQPLQRGGIDIDLRLALQCPHLRRVLLQQPGWIVERGPYFAMGSGRDFALGAMAAGASAEEAVRAAIAHDVYSGGEVVTLRIQADTRPLLKPVS